MGTPSPLRTLALRRTLGALLVVGAAIALAPAPTLADDVAGRDAVQRTFGSDRFAAGGTVTITAPVAGDAFLAGGSVALLAPVAGDALLAGGQVEIRGSVGDSLYASGGNVTFAGEVTRNARLAGGTLALAPASRIGGGATLGGGTVTAAGTVGGYLQAAARDFTLTGRVEGDLEVTAEHIELGPEAWVGGQLRWRSRNAPRLAEGATVVGGLQQLEGRARQWSWPEGAGRVAMGVGAVLWYAGLVALGALFVLVLPGFSAGASALVRERSLASLGLGFALLVAVPIGAVLLMVTLVGIPVALLLLMLYAIALLLGYVVGALALGDFVLARAGGVRAGLAGWRILGLALALLALGLFARVPFLGALLVFLVFLAGLGALALRAAGSRVSPAGAAGPPPRAAG